MCLCVTLCLGGWQDERARFQSWNLGSPAATEGYNLANDANLRGEISFQIFLS